MIWVFILHIGGGKRLKKYLAQSRSSVNICWIELKQVVEGDKDDLYQLIKFSDYCPNFPPDITYEK